MKSQLLLALSLAALISISASAQPSYEAPPPDLTVVEDASQRRAQYMERVDEVLTWRAGLGTENMGMATISAKLILGQDIDKCSERVIELMQTPGTGPFWMFPVAGLAFTGRDLLSPEAQASIRDAWRTTFQMRGDTENHFAMYYAALYLMSELYPNEPGDSW
ncbi:MAG: hypothetical protein JKY51_01640, partial [Opitutaceae bacterium]|nr:hypothetical protein [Opitutaceae bacterium]